MRPTRVLFLAFCLAAVSAQAQTTRVYAPEDLSALRESDRVRVIAREYEQQSGRIIPDDQLDFYLDQVDAGWRMSDIRADIARSLRPGGVAAGHPGQPGHAGDVGGERIRCESVDQRRRDCRTGFRARAVLVQQLSRTRCVEGRNWGHSPGRLWVDGGCRGEFAEDLRWQSDYNITCSSVDDRYATCRWDGRRGRPQMVEQLSRADCTEGRTWGWREEGVVWVDRGCRARFAATGYGVGDDDRYDRYGD